MPAFHSRMRLSQNKETRIHQSDAGYVWLRRSVRIAQVVSSAERVLREVFGLADFRPGQADVVAAMLAGRVVLSVAPTGSGKSISYWVPAVVEGGLTMGVSPLSALTKDQVDRLTDCGVAATFINSSVEPSEQRERLRRA